MEKRAGSAEKEEADQSLAEEAVLCVKWQHRRYGRGSSVVCVCTVRWQGRWQAGAETAMSMMNVHPGGMWHRKHVMVLQWHTYLSWQV